MRNNYYKIARLLLFSAFFLANCSKPLNKVDFSKGNHKLYFIEWPTSLFTTERTDFQNRYQNFFIDDITALNDITECVLNRTFGNNPSNNFYILRLVNGKEQIDGAVLDLDNNVLLYGNDVYSFDFNRLQNLSKNFHNIHSFEVNCVTIPNIKSFFDFIKSTNGFILANTEDGKNPLANFKGQVVLRTDARSINFSGKREDIDKKFIADFKNIGETSKIGLAWEGGDSVTVTLLWDDDYSNNLPKGYRLIKEFTDTIDMPFQVYNIDKKEILGFFEKNEIEGYDIKDLNKK